MAHQPRIFVVAGWRYEPAWLVDEFKTNVSAWADEIVIVDDRARTDELWVNESHYRLMQRNALLEAGIRPWDWVVVSSPDERWERSAARVLPRLARTRHKIVYTFPLREMWTPTEYRVDGMWGTKIRPRMFPFLPGQRFTSRKIQTSPAPIDRGYARVRINRVQIFHLENIDPASRVERAIVYEALSEGSVARASTSSYWIKHDPQRRYMARYGFAYLADARAAKLRNVPPSRGFDPPVTSTYEFRVPDRLLVAECGKTRAELEAWLTGTLGYTPPGLTTRAAAERPHKRPTTRPGGRVPAARETPSTPGTAPAATVTDPPGRLPDVVIPVKAAGGRNEELRYTLRSFQQNLPHRRVWIIGDLPDWATNVGHIPTQQGGRTKYKNTTLAVRLACEHPDISDTFILANDDMFCMQPVPGRMPAHHRGPVSDLETYLARKYPRQRNPYLDGLRNTRDLLVSLGYDDPLCYEVHVPLEIDSTVMLKTLDVGKHIPVLHKRTLYAHLAGLAGTRIRDPKVLGHGLHGWAKDQPWISTQDTSFRHGAVGRFLRARFNRPSSYEKAARP